MQTEISRVQQIQIIQKEFSTLRIQNKITKTLHLTYFLHNNFFDHMLLQHLLLLLHHNHHHCCVLLHIVRMECFLLEHFDSIVESEHLLPNQCCSMQSDWLVVLLLLHLAGIHYCIHLPLDYTVSDLLLSVDHPYLPLLLPGRPSVVDAPSSDLVRR